MEGLTEREREVVLGIREKKVKEKSKVKREGFDWWNEGRRSHGIPIASTVETDLKRPSRFFLCNRTRWLVTRLVCSARQFIGQPIHENQDRSCKEYKSHATFTIKPHKKLIPKRNIAPSLDYVSNDTDRVPPGMVPCGSHRVRKFIEKPNQVSNDMKNGTRRWILRTEEEEKQRDTNTPDQSLGRLDLRDRTQPNSIQHN
ncbi:unnamed protein product [Dovyalis caffra]|uniref:Uncharacterized protein n=1 Tax=Dovyalis caffra TaxID=77055 RepID=A0AAV1R9G4_9ROSI|nr:unnamed protein product [Dovyalis caffra]